MPELSHRLLGEVPAPAGPDSRRFGQIEGDFTLPAALKKGKLRPESALTLWKPCRLGFRV